MSSRDDQRAALVEAHDFYRRHLRGSWVPGYLDQRGLAAQTESAQLGYAPHTWTALTDHLRRSGHTDQTLLEAGLARESSAGNLIDTLRDRLAVPVSDTDQRLVGFTARAAPGAEEDVPKWLNTATTDLFQKRQLLYALGEDLPALQRGATPVLVEGAMDRLAIREASGHVQVVGLGTLGTALTDQHVDTLTEHLGTHRAIAVCFDADPAGQRATLAAWELLSRTRGPEDGTLLYVALPPGHDPASLVQAGEADQLRTRLLRPSPLAHVAADLKIDAAGPLDHIGKQLALARDLVQDVPHLHRTTVSGYLAHLGRRLGLDHPTITREALDALGSTDQEADLAAQTSSAAEPTSHSSGATWDTHLAPGRAASRLGHWEIGAQSERRSTR